MKKVFFLLVVLSSMLNLYGQEYTGNTDIYIIDSYVTQETPYRLVVSFFTSDSTTAKVVLENNKEYLTSETFTDNHKVTIDISNFTFDSNYVKYYIVAKNKAGELSKSDKYEAALPVTGEIKAASKSNIFEVCCFGGIIFGLPEPTLIRANGENYFSLKKEIPLFSFYSSGYNYPMSYFSVEYQHIFKQHVNFMRAGYKHIFQIPYLEYISPGISGFTNFKGKNGITPEISVGLLRVYNVFTLNVKYRYNFKPNESNYNFSEISIGLYSNFFSINL